MVLSVSLHQRELVSAESIMCVSCTGERRHKILHVRECLCDLAGIDPQEMLCASDAATYHIQL